MEKNRKGTILVVDDEAMCVSFLVNLLKDEYTLFVAKNGHNAISMAMNIEPDLILLDVNMPDMTGHEVILALRHIRETSNIPVIFISNLDSPKDIEQGLKLGAVDYIQKSVEASTMKQRILSKL